MLLCNFSFKGWESELFELGSERVKQSPGIETSLPCKPSGRLYCLLISERTTTSRRWLLDFKTLVIWLQDVGRLAYGRLRIGEKTLTNWTLANNSLASRPHAQTTTRAHSHSLILWWYQAFHGRKLPGLSCFSLKVALRNQLIVWALFWSNTNRKKSPKSHRQPTHHVVHKREYYFMYVQIL